MGIISRYSCPYTFTQNGHVERKHRPVVETSLTLLAQAELPIHFLWDSFLTVTMLINAMPTKVLNGKSPSETLFKLKPNLTNLKMFDCACFP